MRGLRQRIRKKNVEAAILRRWGVREFRESSAFSESYKEEISASLRIFISSPQLMMMMMMTMPHPWTINGALREESSFALWFCGPCLLQLKERIVIMKKAIDSGANDGNDGFSLRDENNCRRLCVDKLLRQ